MASFTANFGKSKGGLEASTYWAFFDSELNELDDFVLADGELEPNTGIYYIEDETPPANAFWLVWIVQDGDINSYLILGLQEKAFVFYFGEAYTEKEISYQFFTEENVPTGPIITDDVIEWEEDDNTGIYLPLEVVIPVNAVFIKAWTNDAPPVYIAGAIDFDSTVYLQAPRTGPYAEEVET